MPSLWRIPLILLCVYTHLVLGGAVECKCICTHSLSVPLGMFLGTVWIPRPWQSTVLLRQLQGVGHASAPPWPANSTVTLHANTTCIQDWGARPVSTAIILQPPDPAPSPLLPEGILLSCGAPQHCRNQPTDPTLFLLPGMTDQYYLFTEVRISRRVFKGAETAA